MSYAIKRELVKLVCIYGVGIGLTACSSSPKQEDQNEQSPNIVAEEPLAQQQSPKTQSAPKVETQLEAKKTVQTTPSSYQGISDAIKSQNDEAIYRSATSLLSMSPGDAKAQNALGLYHYRKGRFQAAQYFFNHALRTNPGATDIYNNLGLSLLAQGERREAIGAFRKAVELDSNNMSAAVNLASIYISEKDYAKALVPLEMAVKRGTKDARILNNYGVALTGTGKYSQAKDQYQAALSVNSSAKDVMLNLAILQIEHLKSFQEGTDLINKIRFLGVPEGSRTRINSLESKAKAGLK